MRDFFLEAFRQLGGVIQAVEAGRYLIAQVPQSLRSRRTQRRYPRVCFDKAHVAGSRRAEMITPSHALFAATCDALLARDGAVLDRGALLVDEQDGGKDARALLAIESAIGDGTGVFSRRLHFIELDGRGLAREAGPAPHLDYRSANANERARIGHTLDKGWLADGLHERADSYARDSLLPAHVDEIAAPRLERLDKTEQAVRQRLNREIRHWDSEQRRLRQLEMDGKPTRISSQRARQWAADLHARLHERLAEIQRERQVWAMPPVIRAAAIVVPAGMLSQSTQVHGTRQSERIAMQAVMDAERRLGFEPRDVSAENRGYDIESYDATSDRTRHIEVKGRRADAATVTLTSNEVRTACNEPDRYILAIARIADGRVSELRYVRDFPFQPPPFYRVSENVRLTDLAPYSSAPA